MIRKLIVKVVKSRVTYMLVAGGVGLFGLEKYQVEIMALIQAIVGQ